MTTTSFTAALSRLLPSEAVPDVAVALGVSERTVRSWLRRERVTTPSRVFALEAVLDLAPGTLSRHLGYVPADVAATTVAEDRVRELATEEAARYRVDAIAPLTDLLERVDPDRAAHRGLQLELLRVAVEDFEATHGRLAPAELAAARRELGLHDDQPTSA